MRKLIMHVQSSPVALAGGTFALFALVYVALIAVVMSYVALTIEFTQSVRNDEAAVASLEQQYLARVAEISTTDYTAMGYDKPTVQTYVPTESVTALR